MGDLDNWDHLISTIDYHYLICDGTAKVFPVGDSDVLGVEMSDKANLSLLRRYNHKHEETSEI